MYKPFLKSRVSSSKCLFPLSQHFLSNQTHVNYQRPSDRKVVRNAKMTASEAFVETLVSHGVTDVFGIVGSAFMDALDLFPDAGIRFIPVQHEQNAGHMADGYARISGKHGVCIAQNGPGITNFVTPIAAAYWAHSPVVVVTPECGSNTKGLGGFQEVDQMPIFSSITKYQTNIVNGNRMAELTSRAFDIAMYERGPTQINIPRDMFYHEATYDIPYPRNLDYPCGNVDAIHNAVELLSRAKNPIILAGGGVVMSPNNAIQSVKSIAELLNIPVATTYLHNDAFPSDHKLFVGPLGYQGFLSSMKALSQSDCILALGSRLNPFGTLPQYDFDYWPKDAKIIQVDIDSRRLGLTKRADVYIHGDCSLVGNQIFSTLKNLMHSSKSTSIGCLENTQQRLNTIKQIKQEWEKSLHQWTISKSDKDKEDKVKPRQALYELQQAMPDNVIVSTDIGNVCSVANSYLRFKNSPSFLAAMTFGNCQYALGAAMGAKIAAPERPVIAYAGDGAFGMGVNELMTCVREKIPVTCIVFNNEQWGAEKKNQTLWFNDRYVGVNLHNPWSYAEIARAFKCYGIRVTHKDEVGDALKQAIDNQMKDGITTVIEIVTTRELSSPFRRDAMKYPVRRLDKYKHLNVTKESPMDKQPID